MRCVELVKLAGISRWADVLGMELIAGASNRPLLSGFYRMMAVALRLSEEAGIFAQQGAHDSGDPGFAAYSQVQAFYLDVLSRPPPDVSWIQV